MSEYLYRYDDQKYSRGLDMFDEPIRGFNTSVVLNKFEITKRTPKGAWVKLYGWDHKEKFVLLTARKQYACETLEEAKQSFRMRKRRQIKILTAQLEHVKLALQQIDGIQGDI